MDLTASSAVNLPITSASLRLVVVFMGVRSIRSTYSGERVTATVHFHNKVRVFHGFPYSSFEREAKRSELQMG
jgi:hypothetical protein